LRMLAPIRDHIAAAHQPAPDDLQAAAAYYAHLAGTVGRQVGGADGARAAVRFQAETGNITVMLTQAAAGRRTSDLTAGVTGLAEYWRFTGYRQPALAQLIETEVRAHGTVAEQAVTLKALGDSARAQYDHAAAGDHFQQALALYDQIGDARGQADCVKGLGDIALRRADLVAAGDCFQRALALYEQVGDVLGQANCIQRLGDIALDRSDHTVAGDRFRQALPLYEQVGRVLGQANCVQGLGDIARARSDYAAARGLYQQALPLYEQVGSLQGQANCILGLGEIALDESDYAAARSRFQQALPLYEQVGSVLGQANCVQGLGDIALARSDYAAARGLYQQALVSYQVIEDPFSIGWTYIRLARLDPPGADRDRHWLDACQVWRSIGRDDLVTSVRVEFADSADLAPTTDHPDS